MGLPNHPVSLTPAQVADLNHKLSNLRHDANNHLTLLATALELIRRDPGSAARLAPSLVDQPQKIRDELIRFSREFEASLGITRD